MKTTSYKDLIVWQKSVALSVRTYKITKNFPKEEIYGISSQMRRSAISIPSNIAEGRHRGSKKDYVRFLYIAHASCAELETQFEISKQLNFLNETDCREVNNLTTEVSKMLHVMIKKLQS